jgi:hypothetical protein
MESVSGLIRFDTKAFQLMYGRFWRILLKNSVLERAVIADSFRPVGAGDRIDDGSAAG